MDATSPITTTARVNAEKASPFRWFLRGDEIFVEMLQAIEAATESICLETYIYRADKVGLRFLEALVGAARRGVRVQVLIDSFGAAYLADEFWEPLRMVGGEIRWFNPLNLRRVWFRDHRKLLVCDKQVLFVGGFNIAEEYEGDGVNCGWCDLGLSMRNPLARELVDSFDRIFARASLKHKLLARLPHPWRRKEKPGPEITLLESGPGYGAGLLKRWLRLDMLKARSIRIVAAYFLPTWRIRRTLMRHARSGQRVQLILAGKSDVPLSQMASRRLYRSMLRAGIEIYEYQPQILHAKLVLLDNLVYVGSANFDIRSLDINYELMLRLRDPGILYEANLIFEQMLSHSRRIDYMAWRAERSFWSKLKERWAYFLLARVDPYLARRQMQRLKA